MDRDRQQRLGEALVAAGKITADQLEQALARQRTAGGGPLGSHLLQLGYLSADDLAEVLGEVFGVRPLRRAEVLGAAPEVAALLSPEFCRRHRVLPVRVDGEDLHLAMADPADTLALHEAAFLTGFRIVPRVVPDLVLRDALERFHGLPARAAGPADEPSPSSPLDTGAIPVPPRGAPLRETGQKLALAMERDDVLAILLDALAERFPRSAVLLVRDRVARIWGERSLPLPRGASRDLPIEPDGVLAPLLPGSRPAWGPVALTPGNRRLYERLGGLVPPFAWVGPVHLRGRVVLGLYGDVPEPAVTPPDLTALETLCRVASWALETILLRRKILKLTGGGADERRSP